MKAKIRTSIISPSRGYENASYGSYSTSLSWGTLNCRSTPSSSSLSQRARTISGSSSLRAESMSFITLSQGKSILKKLPKMLNRFCPGAAQNQQIIRSAKIISTAKIKTRYSFFVFADFISFSPFFATSILFYFMPILYTSGR